MRFLLLLPLAFLSGCATTPDAARQALAATETAQAALITAFEHFDDQIQESIARAARDSGQVNAGAAALLAYRQKRAKVVSAILSIRGLLALGPAVIALVESGQRDKSSIGSWLSELEQASRGLLDSLAQLGMGVP